MTLGIGTTSVHFHTPGMNPSLNEELKLGVIGGDKNLANSHSTQCGIPSAHAAFFTLIAINFFSTTFMDTRKISGRTDAGCCWVGPSFGIPVLTH